MVWPLDPLFVPHDQLQPAGPGPGPALDRELAGHRRPGPRRGGPADLRFPHLDPVRADADHPVLDRRRSRPARCRAISAASSTCCSSASSRSGQGLPTLYLLIILASIVEPNFWWLLGLLLLFSWMSLVGVVRAEFLRARNFDYVRAARALGVGGRADHVPARAAQRDGGDADLHAVHPERLDHDADLARFPRLRPAAGLALAGRVAGAGQGQPPGAVARPDRVLHARASC